MPLSSSSCNLEASICGDGGILTQALGRRNLQYLLTCRGLLGLASSGREQLLLDEQQSHIFALPKRDGVLLGTEGIV